MQRTTNNDYKSCNQTNLESDTDSTNSDDEEYLSVTFSIIMSQQYLLFRYISNKNYFIENALIIFSISLYCCFSENEFHVIYLFVSFELRVVSYNL